MINHPYGLSADSAPNVIINESLYAWTNVPVPATVLDPKIACTLTLKVNYLIDVHCTKNNLVV